MNRPIQWLLWIGMLLGCDALRERPLPQPTFQLRLGDDYFRLTSADTAGIILDLLANDTVSDKAVLTLGKARYGQMVSLSNPTRIIYRPKKFFAGFDTATYRVCVGDSSCAVARVFFSVYDTLSIASIRALRDSFSVIEGLVVPLAVTQNDILKANTYGLTLARPALLGQVNLKGGTVYYQASTSLFGDKLSGSEIVVDSFEYRISAPLANQSTAWAVVKIQPDCGGIRLRAVRDEIVPDKGKTVITISMQDRLLNDKYCTNDRDFLIKNMQFGKPIYGSLFNTQNPDVKEYKNSVLVLDSFPYVICAPAGRCDTGYVVIRPKQ